MLKEKTIEDFKVGDKASITKTITETDVYLYAGITGDFAPHHINAEFAKTTMFKERIAHGTLIGGFTSAATAKLVSPGAISLSHEMKFLAPVKFGDTITATAEIVEIIPEKKIIKIRAYCTNQRGELVLDGMTVQLMRVR